MPNPTLIGFPSANFSAATSVVVNTDPSTQIGDVYISVCYATVGIGAPAGSGWTQILPAFGNDGTIAGDFVAYWKTATVAGGEAVTLNFSSSSGCAAIATIRGTYPNFPVANYSYFEAIPVDTWAVPPISIGGNLTGVLVVAMTDDGTAQTWGLAPSLTQQMLELESGTSQIAGWYTVQIAAGMSVAYAATKTGGNSGGAIIAIYLSSDPLQLTAPNQAVAGVGDAYAGPGLSATGGTPGYTYAISAGGLPPGLSLNSSTGAITGTPTGVEPTQFTGQVTDSFGTVVTQDGTIYVYATPPPISPDGPTIIGDLLPDFIGQTTDLDGGAAGGVNINLPPFKYNGSVYVASTNVMTDGTFRQFLSVARSSNPATVPFASLDSADAPEVNSNAAPCPILDLPNNRILFLVADGTGANPPQNTTMSVQVFNLTTSLWDTPMATGGPTTQTSGGDGPFTYNGWFNQVFRQITPTKFMVLYYAPHTGQDPDIYSVTLTTAGVWGTPQLILASNLSAPNVFPVLGGMGVDGNGITWVLYYAGGTTGGAHCPLFFNSVSTSGVVGTPTQIYSLASNTTPTDRCGGFGTYITSSDTMVWGWHSFDNGNPSPPIPNQAALLKITGVSTSPIASFEGIADQPGDASSRGAWGSLNFFTSLDGATWYVGINQITDTGGPLDFGVESIQLFQRPASGPPGTWTGPTTFYDSGTNPPGGPVYHNSPDVPTPPAELNSLSFTFFADGTLATTVGMLSDWCGVIFYLSTPGGPGPLTLACPINNTGTIGVPYLGMLIASGGTPPYTYAIL